MTLKGQARTDYMRQYMRVRRGSPLADGPPESTRPGTQATPAEVPLIEVKPPAAQVEIEQNPYPVKVDPVKPQFVRPFSRHDQAHPGKT
jgi:hypothetical protein